MKMRKTTLRLTIAIVTMVTTACALTPRAPLVVEAKHFELTPRPIPHVDAIPAAMLERFKREKENFDTPPTNIVKKPDGAVFLVTPNHDEFRLMTADVLENARSYRNRFWPRRSGGLHTLSRIHTWTGVRRERQHKRTSIRLLHMCFTSHE